MGTTGMVAAAVVGEVVLRGGEAGSVVPTNVPGNLEARECLSGHCASSEGAPCVPRDTPRLALQPQAAPAHYLHGALGAGSTRESKASGGEMVLPCPHRPPLLPGILGTQKFPKGSHHPWASRQALGRAPLLVLCQASGLTGRAGLRPGWGHTCPAASAGPACGGSIVRSRSSET